MIYPYDSPIKTKISIALYAVIQWCWPDGDKDSQSQLKNFDGFIFYFNNHCNNQIYQTGKLEYNNLRFLVIW